MENSSLQLLKPAPEERLVTWLAEFYGKPVEIKRRELLRHRDLSFVERLWIADALPETLIYKLVLPPWDVEQDLHERVLIPSISGSARLFLSGRFGNLTALFLEDLGNKSLLNATVDAELASQIGRELAKLQRAYSYRTDELMQMNVLRSLLPIDYSQFTGEICRRLSSWKLVDDSVCNDLLALSELLSAKLVGEPISIVHGDLYAENILVSDGRLSIIDWSWFTMIGVPTLDLATLTMRHHKNGAFADWKDTVLDAYCFESGRSPADVAQSLPYAEGLSRLLFLHWLVERRSRGIMGTTVGPVDGVIAGALQELRLLLAALPS